MHRGIIRRTRGTMFRTIKVIPFLSALWMFLSGNGLVGAFLPTARAVRTRCRGRIPLSLHLSTLSSSAQVNAHEEKQFILDTSMYDDKLEEVMQWLNGLTQIHRSEPFWISNCDNGHDITTLSPSKLVQQHFDQLLASTTPAATATTTPSKAPIVLFENPQDQSKFDAQWQQCLQTMLPDHEFDSILQTCTSNTHPLRLQLVACPKDTCFSLHVHPAVELDIPLVGDLYEQRAVGVVLDRTTLQRDNDVLLSSSSSSSSSSSHHTKPTPQELARVSQKLSQHVVFEDYGPQGIFTNHCIPQGQALVNLVGSVHQSYTATFSKGCLLLVLGPNVHAYFEPGNFRQRQGIEQLQGIDELLEGWSRSSTTTTS